MPTTCFYKQNNKIKEQINLKDNKHNVFTDDMELDTEHEVSSVKIITKEKENSMEKEIK